MKTAFLCAAVLVLASVTVVRADDQKAPSPGSKTTVAAEPTKTMPAPAAAATAPVVAPAKTPAAEPCCCGDECSTSSSKLALSPKAAGIAAINKK